MQTVTDIGSRPSAVAKSDPVETCLLWVLEYLGKPMSAAALRASVARLPGPWTFPEAIEALDSLGFRCREKEMPLADALGTHTAAMCVSDDGVVAAICPKTETQAAALWVPQQQKQQIGRAHV